MRSRKRTDGSHSWRGRHVLCHVGAEGLSKTRLHSVHWSHHHRIQTARVCHTLAQLESVNRVDKRVDVVRGRSGWDAHHRRSGQDRRRRNHSGAIVHAVSKVRVVPWARVVSLVVSESATTTGRAPSAESSVAGLDWRRSRSRNGKAAFLQKLAVCKAVGVLHALQYAFASLDQFRFSPGFDNVAANNLGDRMATVDLILEDLLQDLITRRFEDCVQHDVDSFGLFFLVDN